MKTFAAYIKSESGDGYLISFKAVTQPEGEEWRPIFKKEIPWEESDATDGPGDAGTYLYVMNCLEIAL